MTENTQPANKVTIVHIFEHLNQADSKTVKNIIENNAFFLHSHNVEYIVIDNLSNTDENLILQTISQTTSWQEKKLEYIKTKNQSLKESFALGAKIAKQENIFYIFNEISLNMNNIFEVETTAPLLKKTDVEYFQRNLPQNFHPKNFKLYMKKDKKIFEKIQLYFLENLI